MAFNINVVFSAIVVAACIAVVLVSGFQFEVGKERGWTKPTGKEPETYNEWAAQNRFRIGDSLQFKYQNDSVLVVTASDYLQCDASNPISKFEDGNTVFRFDRSGFFYFISGNPDHCKSGQKLIVRVMHPSELAESPEISPDPATGGGDWGSPASSTNGTTKLYAVSYLMSAVAGLLFLVFYMFVV